MKLLQISIEVNSNSVGKIAEQIGVKAIECGFDSYITYARNHNQSASKLIKIGSLLDVWIHGLETRIFDNHGFGSRLATKKLIKKIEVLNPDIIHLHHLHGYFINIKILFEYLSNKDIPIVWTFHDCWSFTGHCAYFDYVGCYKWMNECNNCEQKTSYPKSLLFDRSKVNFVEKKHIFNSVQNMVIVPVSNWLGNLVRQSFLKNYPLEVIQNGIDTEVFSPRFSRINIEKRFKIENKFLVLGVASTWDKRKGLEEFIKLDSLLCKDDFQIILIGLSQQQIKSLPSSIIGIEKTENAVELADFYSSADVFVNPTLEDTYPTTNLESMSCGTPVISYNTGGSVESIDNLTGLIVEKEDVDGLYSAILEIKNNGKSIYTVACREKAKLQFNKNSKFIEYISLYKKLLKI